MGNDARATSQPPAMPPTQLNATMKSTIKERIAFMWNNEALSDIHFIVGQGDQQQRIPAHRFILSVGSEVFCTMFNGSLATPEEVEVPDVEPAAFSALLKFLYTDEVDIGPATVMTTLYAAQKYMVKALEEHCVQYLKNNLDSENAFMLLTQARLFDKPLLALLCLEIIHENTSDALGADGFTDLDLECLTMVLKRDTLNIPEAEIFKALVKWSEAECVRQNLPPIPEHQRSVLGRALQLVRFPRMSAEEFAQGPAQSGLLSDREMDSLFRYFYGIPKPAINFQDTSRLTA